MPVDSNGSQGLKLADVADKLLPLVYGCHKMKQLNGIFVDIGHFVITTSAVVGVYVSRVRTRQTRR